MKFKEKYDFRKREYDDIDSAIQSILGGDPHSGAGQIERMQKETDTLSEMFSGLVKVLIKKGVLDSEDIEKIFPQLKAVAEK